MTNKSPNKENVHQKDESAVVSEAQEAPEQEYSDYTDTELMVTIAAR